MKRTLGNVALAVLLVLGLLLPMALPVGAAGPVKYVDATFGNDTTGDGSMGKPYKTIQKGIDEVDAGGTVYVAAGIYNEKQIVINKAVTVLGAGMDASIIDGGGGAGGLTQAGTVRIVTTGDVTFSGFTVRNPDSVPITKGGSPKDLRVGILAQNSNAAGGNTFTITRVKILGTNLESEDEDYGLYANNSYASLVFRWCEIAQTGANAILIEQHSGATDVSYNTIQVGPGSDCYFSMAYGGKYVSTLQKVHHNTFDMNAGVFDYAHRAAAITFCAAFTGVDGGYTNIEVTENHITGLREYRRGIGTWNNSSGSGAGLISNMKIIGNVISGNGNTPTYGISLLGRADGTVVEHNVVTGADKGFEGRAWKGHVPQNTTLKYNVFSNNASGVVWDASSPQLDAEMNWWGDSSGPGPVGPGSGDKVSANVDYDPWATALVTLTPAQQSMYEGESKTVDINVKANNLYGLQMIVLYDATQLEVTGATWDDSWFHPDQKVWDMDYSTPGQVKIAASQQRDLHPDPASGEGRIGQITFRCKAQGVDHLDLDKLILSEKEAVVIPSTYSSACLINLGPRPGTVTAKVDLQGRANESGAVLTLWPGGYSGTSNATGDITIASVPPGTYTAVLAMTLYLDTEKSGVVVTSGGTTALSPVKLLGGDANEDDTINIQDIAIIGGAFDTTPPSVWNADINADGTVNILDLVLPAGNYLLSSPQPSPWP